MTNPQSGSQQGQPGTQKPGQQSGGGQQQQGQPGQKPGQQQGGGGASQDKNK
jgi:hypothetical protein